MEWDQRWLGFGSRAGELLPSAPQITTCTCAEAYACQQDREQWESETPEEQQDEGSGFLAQTQSVDESVSELTAISESCRRGGGGGTLWSNTTHKHKHGELKQTDGLIYD